MSPDELRLLSAARTAAANGELREQRESRRLLIQEVADSVGVSPLTLSRWEKGTATPRNSAVLLRLAEVLEITAGAA
ncbi:helix-turn-helix transcriptional regulator [Streptomyces bottropensis]|uniref:Helix-turn-helix transcriptional regulator n=1 Tax=Streptomyces bottropensis TaxID=42235 RepID=A0ABU8AUD3_9ACTN